MTIYGRSVLRSRRRALTLGGLLAALYGLLFVLLQIQDYALLAGIAGPAGGAGGGHVRHTPR